MIVERVYLTAKDIKHVTFFFGNGFISFVNYIYGSLGREKKIPGTGLAAWVFSEYLSRSGDLNLYFVELSSNVIYSNIFSQIPSFMDYMFVELNTYHKY